MPSYGNYRNPTPKGTARIWWDPDVLAYRLVTPFNPQFVEALKALIPASDRVWDPAAKQWTIHESYLDALSGFCEKIFGDKPTVLSRAQAEAQATAGKGPTGSAHSPSITRGQPLDVTIVAFFRLLSYDAAKAAFRKAAMEYHPDAAGGDQAKAAKMSDLNAAWTRIEKELFSK